MSNEPVISAEDEGYLRAIEPNLEVRDEPEPAHALDLARAEATWGFRTVIPTIDKAFASPERCDVGKTAFIYFHLGWGNGTSIDEGLIKLDGHEYEANSTGWIAIGETCDSPRKTQWGVSSIDVYGWTEFSQIVDDPSVIWDTVSLYIEPDQRVSSLEDVEWSGVYEYNNEKFVGTVFFNDTLNQGVGEYGLSVTRIKDNKYGLTSFKAVELKIILDKVVIEIFNDTPRVNVGGTPELESTILELQQRIADYHSQTESLTSQIQVIEADKEDLEAEGLRLEAELAEAEAQLGEARSAKQSLESQATSLQNRITSLNAEIQTKATEITRLSDEKKALEKQASNLQATVESQSTRIFNLESERSKILGIVVTQHYEHVYGGWLWQDRYQWDLDIPLSLYWEYRSRQRPTSYAKWVDMAKDTGDDRYIDELVRQINSAAIEEGFTEKEKVEFVIAFVQSLPYTEDRVTTPWNEYPRYPMETLFDRGGDCEDTSILVAALLDRLGYDTALLLLYKEYHAAVGVAIAGASGSYYTVDGERYYYLETTGEGYSIGQIPSEFDERNAYVYPLNP